MKHLLLLHGALGSASQLASLAAELKDQFTVHTPDFPGHGGSAAEEFSISSFAQFTAGYCKEKGLGQVSIFGYSMGGYVACYLARHHPELVQGIVTLATKFHWDPPTAQRETALLQPAVIEEKIPKFAATLRARHAPGDWKDLLHQTAAMLTDMGNRNPLTVADLEAITVPVLVTLGDRDKMVSFDETLAAYRKLKNAQLAVLPGTPHPLEGVDPSWLALLIRRFLNQ